MSAAPVVWILCSEIQPLKCRDFWYHLLNHHQLGVKHDYRRDLPDAAGSRSARREPFWLYTALNVAFIGVTFWLIPETKTSPLSILNAS